MSSQGQVSNPAEGSTAKGFPENSQLLIYEQFSTLNTKPPRPGIKEEEMAWCDGFMPIGPNNLRTLYGTGPSIFNAPRGVPFAFFGFCNIGPTPYLIALHSDGGVWAVNTNTKVATQIAPDGTISNPSPLTTGLSQWSSIYLIIVSKQTNGYWLWDGTSLYSAGTIGPTITVTNGGSGYTAPTVTISGGSGSGAVLSATVVGGIITTINVVNPGTGYLATDTITVSISDSTGTSATATASLMPFGVSGTAAETFTSIVWIINGPVVTFSAPGSPTDFSTSDGGGSFTSFDSFLNVGYTQIKQSNGFLYLIGDSSINYISGVSTSGNPPTTTFTNQNVDPQIGSPWPGTLQLFTRNLVFGNSLGIYVSYGGAVQKISEPLDGIYNTVPNFGGLLPSGAVANIFGIEVFMQLTPVIDSYTGQQTNKLLMWSGQKWFTSQQDVSLTYVASQKINSVLTAWGTDGQGIYPLFQTPSKNFTKVSQSKLWAKPHYLYTKLAGELYGVLDYFILDGESVEFIIDNENTGASYNAPPVGGGTSWINASDASVAWINASSQPVVWGLPGIDVFGPLAVQQSGAFIGMTVQTNASDLALLSATILEEVRQANV